MDEELRFGFGNNWQRYLASVGQEPLDNARNSIVVRHGSEGLAGKDRWSRPLLIAGAWCRLWGVKFIADSLHGNPWRRWRSNNDDPRGTSAKHDLIDWVGGYPFELAKPKQIFRFLRAQGFELTDLMTQAGGIGCNEYFFRRRHERPV